MFLLVVFVSIIVMARNGFKKKGEKKKRKYVKYLLMKNIGLFLK